MEIKIAYLTLAIDLKLDRISQNVNSVLADFSLKHLINTFNAMSLSVIRAIYYK